VRRAVSLPLLLLVLAARTASADGLYVVGQVGQSVLEYDAASGAYERVVAETITQGFVNPGGIALRPSDGVLHVASGATGEIWRYTTATGLVILPALRTGLYGPRGLAFDATGATLFFGDPKDILAETTDSVKALALPAGTLTTVGTTMGAEFGDVAVNGAHVYASDSEGNRVVRFPTGGGSGTTVISTGLSTPTGLLFRSTTRMLIADSGSHRVLEYLLSAGTWNFDRVVLPASAGVVSPCGLALAPDASLTVTGCGSDTVVQVDLGTLAVTPLVAAGAGGLTGPEDAEWSGSTLLVASPAANAVLYFDAAGDPTGVAARGISPVLDGGLAFSPDGEKLYLASLSDNKVLEHDATSGTQLRSLTSPCFLLPIDVAWGPDGKLYVTCFGDGGVGRIDPATGLPLGAFVLGGSGGLVNPRSLAFGPDGHLYVSSGNGEILRFHGTTGDFLGVFVDVTGNGGGPVDPYGLAFHQGRLYVASFFPSEVRAFHATTGAYVSTFVAAGAGGLDGPTALAFGPDGELYVTSQGDDAVRRYDGATGTFLGVFVASGSGGLDGPFDLAFRALPEPASIVPGLASGALLLAGLQRRRRAHVDRLRSRGPA